MIDPPSPSHIEIHVASDEAALLEVGAFRYGVFCEEQGKQSPSADARARTIVEAEDWHGVVLIARDPAGVIIGTVRYHALSAEYLSRHFDDPWASALLPFAARRELAVTARLMVRADHRGGRATWELVKNVYRRGLGAGVRLCAIHVAPDLAPMYARLGYRLLTSARATGNGVRSSMLLALRDLRHLRSVRSPFVRHAHGLDQDDEAAALIEDSLFPTTILCEAS